MGNRKRSHDGDAESTRPAKRAVQEYNAEQEDEKSVDALTATACSPTEPHPPHPPHPPSTDADASIVDPEDGFLRCCGCDAAIGDGDGVADDCPACEAPIVYCYSCNNTTDPLWQVCRLCSADLHDDCLEEDEDLILCPTCDATLEGPDQDWCPYCDEIVDGDEE